MYYMNAVELLAKPTKAMKLRVQLKKAKDLGAIKVDKFKVGKAYHIKNEEGKVLFINALGYHPLSGLAAGFGFITDGEELIPAMRCLHELGDAFNF